jgi:hypothetical protein
MGRALMVYWQRFLRQFLSSCDDDLRGVPSPDHAVVPVLAVIDPVTALLDSSSHLSGRTSRRPRSASARWRARFADTPGLTQGNSIAGAAGLGF